MSLLPNLLIEQLRYVSEQSPYYSKLFKNNDILITEHFSLEQFHQIPFTTKDNLQLNNDDFLSVEQDKIVDIVTTSGTLGSPVAYYLTDADLSRLAENEYSALQHANISAQDVVQITTTIDKMFMAGMAYFLGLRKMGASVIRVGPGAPALHWHNILRFNTTVLIAVPSFILKLIDYALLNQIDLNKSTIKKIVCVGEAIRDENFNLNNLAKTIVNSWDVQLFSTYASTEMATAFTECEFGLGGHINESLVFVECVDENGKQVEDGVIGELVVTTLGVQAMPLVRYKTGDLSFLNSNECKCGRSTTRVGPIIARKQQMIKYKGTTIYPSSISELLRSYNQVKDYLIEISSDEMGLDVVKIYILSDDTSNEILNQLRASCQATLRVCPEILFSDFEVINKMKKNGSFRKPVSIVDKRII